MWQNLIAVLKEITGYYEMLYKLAIKKREVLVSVDLKMLEKLVEKENEITVLVSDAETRRQRILVELSGVCGGLKPNEKSKDLYKYVPDKYRTDLITRHKELDYIISKVTQLAENNTLLISSALSAVNARLNQISGAVVEPAYGQKGNEVITQQKKFDFKA